MSFVIGLALKSLIVAGITLGLLRIFRGASAAQRSWLAHAGLTALLVVPLVALLMPALEVESALVGTDYQVSTPIAATAPISTPSTTGSVAQAATTFTDPVQIDWALLIYAVPAALMLIVTLIALFRLFALRARADVMTAPEWLSALAHAQARMNFKSGAALLVSDALPSPISWGLARPVILLNEGALDATDEAEAIIAHELAHVASMDWAKLLLGRVVSAIYWFNPLIWLLVRDAHQLREEAADDAVLAANVAGPDYAALLVHTARHDCRAAMLAAHGVAPGKGSLQRRVHRVLDHSLPRTQMEARWAAIGALVALFGAAPLAALTIVPKKTVAEPARVAVKQGEPVVAATPAPSASPSAPVADQAREAEIARDETETAADEGEDHADRVRDVRDAVDVAVEARAVGVTPAYAAAMRSAAPNLPSFTTDDLSGMRAVGVTPGYVHALARSGFRDLDADSITGAYAVGISPDYIRSLAAVGVTDLSLDDLTGLAALGLQASDVTAMRREGYAVTLDNLETYAALRSHGPRPPAPPGTSHRPSRD